VSLASGPVLLGPAHTDPLPPPTRTLGYVALRWAERMLLQPDGPDIGKPWTFTPEQARFVVHWYAIDETGRFIWPRGFLQRMKGAGKDPLGAAWCSIEFLGPCRFGGWKPNGLPRVVAHDTPWVQVAAVSQDQTRNTMDLFDRMFSDAARERYGIDMGREVIYSTRGKLEAVTSSPRSLEGKRTTAVLKNETHHWLLNNSGIAMAQAIERNSVKSRDGSARSLAITNAHVPGEESDAERDWDSYAAYEAGRTTLKRPPFLIDSRQAPPDTDLADDDSLRAGIIAARGDATWLDVDRVMAAVRDPKDPPSLSRRFYLNQVTASEDAWLTAPEWDRCAAPHKAIGLADEIVMFFDGSLNDDSTALVGCRVSDGHVFEIAGWDRPAGAAGEDWEIDKDAVNHAVRKAIKERNVLAFFGDVLHFEGLHDEWSALIGPTALLWAQEGKFRHATAWDMRGKLKDFTLACERTEADVRAGDLTHDGSPALRNHVLNARRRPNRFGVGIGKEGRESSRKIDRAVCAVGARMVRRMLIESERMDKRKRPGVLIAF
jgi:hypothetical protein